MPPSEEKKAVDLSVETTTEERKKANELSNKKANGKKDDEKENTMSEEDQELKDRLETCVSTVINEANEAAVTVPLRLKALDVIVTELRSATASMTSVPKPLKFLRPHFSDIKKLHVKLASTKYDDSTDTDSLLLRARLADVLAVLAMTMGNHGKKKHCF